MDTTEERISELESLSIKIIKTEKQREKKNGSKNPEQNIQKLWNNYKRYNICIMGIPDGEEKNRKKKLK